MILLSPKRGVCLLLWTHHATVGRRNHATVERDEAAAYEGLQRKMAMSEGQEVRSQPTRKSTTCIQQVAWQKNQACPSLRCC